ncbi:uncharacterized protein LOC108608164 [Drosophila busckii]|uniref:uncharacterized protein LOC108608164 n=1 Tax=Drosophila busckii TaxID=30019 RepID=UPI001432CC8E|nr:uncharacterized protein LOC108608164 [Drosophila busckii]
MTQYRVLLSHLATLHATSIAWERAESFSIGERYREMLFELMLSSENDWFITSIKAIVYLAAQHEQLQHEKYQHFIANKLYEKLLKTETLVQPTERMCNVFCHRDASNFNIFFAKHDAERCCLVDFGLSTYSTPAHDIHFMLYMNSTQTTRQLLYQEFIKWYFDALQAKFAELGIPATELSWQEFQADCKRASLVALIISCLCLPIHLLPSKLMATVRSQQAQKFDYWLNVDRRELLDMAMAQDPAYKAKIMALIKELMEQLLASEAQES